MPIEKYIVSKFIDTPSFSKNGRMRPIILMNELQAIADNHASFLGAGREFCIKNNMAWVVTNYVIDIYQMPSSQEVLEFITWPSGHESLRAIRDFLINDLHGNLKVRASSQWILIDINTRRPVRLEPFLSGWECDDSHALKMPFEKITTDISGQTAEFEIRYDDFDVNQHVNNGVYLLWTLESLGCDFIDAHRLRGVKINFRKEIPFGTANKVLVDFEIDGKTTRHLVKTTEINAVIELNWDAA
jgi:medium-chain acyl-[acyl-carrier-protein] hydrolase